MSFRLADDRKPQFLQDLMLIHKWLHWNYAGFLMDSAYTLVFQTGHSNCRNLFCVISQTPDKIQQRQTIQSTN